MRPLRPTFGKQQHTKSLEDFQRVLDRHYEGITYKTFENRAEAILFSQSHAGYLCRLKTGEYLFTFV